MAVFRIEKTQNYTVMSNHHLRDMDLTLKAKGLMSQMLSLPDEWDYTLSGLSHINREKIDAIREAVRELEQAGYITRSRVRNGKGQLQGTEYVIHEIPQDTPEPTLDFPTLDNPTQEKPMLEKPTLGNPTQLNKEVTNKEKPNTESSNTESNLTSSARAYITDTMRSEAVEAYREIIKNNIDFDILMERHRYSRERIGEIADLMLETICTANKTLVIAGDRYPAELVKSKLLKLNSSHIEYVLDCMNQNTSEVRNIKKYLLAVLFNAPSTIDSYYTALVAHDTAHGLI